MTWAKPRPEVRDPWYRAIISHPTLSNATKLLLVVLVDDMKIDGEVSIPRTALAKKMGLHPSRITERIKEAVDAQVLDIIVKGQPGSTAVYKALLPDGAPVRTKRSRRRINADGAPVRTKDMVRLLDQAEVHPSAPSVERELGAPVQSPSTTNPTCTGSPSVAGEPQERNDEKSNGRTDGTGAYVRGNCALCSDSRRLGPDGLCSECKVASTAKARAAS